MKRPAIEAVWMMRPSWCARMIGRATVTHCAAAARLPLIIRCAFSGVSLSQCRSLMLIPALLRRMSRRPISFRMKSPMRRTASGSVRSPGWTWAVPPKFADLPGDLVERGLPAPGQHDRRAFARQRQCRRLADAAAAAGHPYDLALELRHPSLRGSDRVPRRLSPRRPGDERFCAGPDEIASLRSQ